MLWAPTKPVPAHGSIYASSLGHGRNGGAKNAREGTWFARQELFFD